MLTYRNLADVIAAEPFRAFQLRGKDGQTFDVDHHEFIFVSRHFVQIRVESHGHAGVWQKIPLSELNAVQFRP